MNVNNRIQCLMECTKNRQCRTVAYYNKICQTMEDDIDLNASKEAASGWVMYQKELCQSGHLLGFTHRFSGAGVNNMIFLTFQVIFLALSVMVVI